MNTIEYSIVFNTFMAQKVSAVYWPNKSLEPVVQPSVQPKVQFTQGYGFPGRICVKIPVEQASQLIQSATEAEIDVGPWGPFVLC